MALSYPSIQSFFQREVRIDQSAPQGTDISQPGDGFTTEEVERALDPLNSQFKPKGDYKAFEIGFLIPGPQKVTFAGRLVNFTTIHGKSQAQAAAKGWHHMIIRDDTGAIGLKLYFAREPYTLKLGTRLSIWTSYIGTTANSHSARIPGVSCTVSLFPGRDASVQLVIHDAADDSCKAPLGYEPGQPFELMTLKQFINGGHEVRRKRLLACVKSIGARKSITTKKGSKTDLTEVVLFDDTAEILLKIWGDMGLSAREWVPSQTIILLSDPTFRLDFNRPSVGIGSASMVDVDPHFPDAAWLRKYASRKNKKESMDQTIDEGVWDLESALGGEKVYFTLAEVDEYIRHDPTLTFTGFISVLVLDVNLVLYYRRHMLLCTQCCGHALYANTSPSPCPHCQTPRELLPNPKIVGTVLDETGCIAPGRLLWHESAWEDLLGARVGDLVATTTARGDREDENGGVGVHSTETGDVHRVLAALEQRVRCVRVSLGFGWKGTGIRDDDSAGEDGEEEGGGGNQDEWEGEVGRLVVLGVRE